MRPDPEPGGRPIFYESDGPIMHADPNGIDGLGRVNALKMQARMIGVFSPLNICFSRSILNGNGKP